MGLVAVVVFAIAWPLFSRPAGGVPPGPGPAPPAVVPVPADKVAIQFDRGIYRVRAPSYEAVVEGDGCLTSLRLGGTEWLRSSGPVSRGAYFWQEVPGTGVLKLPDVTQPEPNVIAARSEKASIRYEFGVDSLRWHLTNALEVPLAFFVVLNASVVTAVRNDRDEWTLTPVNAGWTTTTWFGGRCKLLMTGSDQLFGPFEDQGQVWGAFLKPNENREIVLHPGKVTDTETGRIAALKAAPVLVPIPPPPTPPSPLPPDPAVSVTKEKGAYRVRTPKYEAVIEDDGCLTSLRSGDVEFLKLLPPISRGAYFHQAKTTLKLPDIAQPARNAITAKSQEASIRFEFGVDLLVLQVTNDTVQEMKYYLLFDPAVTAVKNARGEEARTPVVKEDWPTTSWTAGQAHLTLYGGNRIWGPFLGKYQVWEATLAPKESRRLILKVDAPPPGRP